MFICYLNIDKVFYSWLAVRSLLWFHPFKRVVRSYRVEETLLAHLIADFTELSLFQPSLNSSSPLPQHPRQSRCKSNRSVRLVVSSEQEVSLS